MQVTDISSVSSGIAATNDPNQNRASLKKAAEQFEAVFLRQMIGAMRSASLAEGISDSSASDQFRDMADARTADMMAGNHALGIADMLLRQFDSRVSAAPAPAPITAQAIAPVTAQGKGA